MRITVRLRQGDLGWLALVAGVIAYELKADDGELLSEAVDRYLVRRPVLTTAIIVMTAAHLANAIPERLDPYTATFTAIRRLRLRHHNHAPSSTTTTAPNGITNSRSRFSAMQ